MEPDWSDLENRVLSKQVQLSGYNGHPALAVHDQQALSAHITERRVQTGRASPEPRGHLSLFVGGQLGSGIAREDFIHRRDAQVLRFDVELHCADDFVLFEHLARLWSVI